MRRYHPTRAASTLRLPCYRLVMCLLWPLLCLIGTASAVGADREGATFLDPAGRVSFALPQGWTLVVSLPQDDVVAELLAPTARGSVVLAAESAPPGTTLDRYASDVAVRLERGPRAAAALPTTASSRTLGGEPAHAAVYEASDSGGIVFLYQVVALHGGIAYTLTFTTVSEEKDAYFAQAQTILVTFSFLAAAR